MRGTLDTPSLDRETVVNEIYRHLSAFVGEGHVLTPETNFGRDLEIDSLSIMDMVMELEDRFDISVPMNTVVEIQTVEELADTIITLHNER